MRAERLLSLVALLRQHDRMSAAELARRLEVTPRTVMRDIEVLSRTGVPVYAERGRAGGYALLPGYQPDAESLSPDEARALFIAGGGDVARALGLGDAFGTALRRLSSGMTPGQAHDVGHVLERIIIDPGGWGGTVRHPPALGTIFAAVQDDHRVQVDYRALSSGHGGRRTLDPWGLVLAGSAWYLLAAHRGQPHTYRISRIESLEVLAERAHRPADLDLVKVWQELRTSFIARPTWSVTLRARADRTDLMVRSLRLVVVGDAAISEELDGWVTVTAEVASLRGTVGVLLGYGDWVEVLEPTELRDLMADVARQAVAIYQ